MELNLSPEGRDGEYQSYDQISLLQVSTIRWNQLACVISNACSTIKGFQLSPASNSQVWVSWSLRSTCRTTCRFLQNSARREGRSSCSLFLLTKTGFVLVRYCLTSMIMCSESRNLISQQLWQKFLRTWMMSLRSALFWWWERHFSAFLVCMNSSISLKMLLFFLEGWRKRSRCSSRKKWYRIYYNWLHCLGLRDYIRNDCLKSSARKMFIMPIRSIPIQDGYKNILAWGTTGKWNNHDGCTLGLRPKVGSDRGPSLILRLTSCSLLAELPDYLSFMRNAAWSQYNFHFSVAFTLRWFDLWLFLYCNSYTTRPFFVLALLIPASLESTPVRAELECWWPCLVDSPLLFFRPEVGEPLAMAQRILAAARGHLSWPFLFVQFLWIRILVLLCNSVYILTDGFFRAKRLLSASNFLLDPRIMFVSATSL